MGIFKRGKEGPPEPGTPGMKQFCPNLCGDPAIQKCSHYFGEKKRSLIPIGGYSKPTDGSIFQCHEGLRANGLLGGTRLERGVDDVEKKPADIWVKAEPNEIPQA